MHVGRVGSVILVCGALLALPAVALAVPITTRVSLSSSGAQGNGDSGGGLVSADGTHVAFNSLASNLVAGDTNGTQDVFVRDLATGKTIRVSVSSSGAQSNASSTVDAISPTGRFVLFSSLATNLVRSDTNHMRDVFLRDTQLGTTVRVSVGTHGIQLPGDSSGASMTPGAAKIAFTYYGGGYGQACQGPCILVRDRGNGTTRRITGGYFANGVADPLITADGRYVVFTGFPVLGPGNLYRRDLLTNALVTHGVYTILDATAVSAHGNLVVFDRQLQPTPGNYLINTVVWQVKPYRLIGVSHVTVPNMYTTHGGSISAGGRYVTYTTNAPGEVPGDTNNATDVFRFDAQTGTRLRVSLAAGGGQLSQPSTGGSMRADGSMVVFNTVAGGVVAGDTNAKRDVFVRGVLP